MPLERREPENAELAAAADALKPTPRSVAAVQSGVGRGDAGRVGHNQNAFRHHTSATSLQSQHGDGRQ